MPLNYKSKHTVWSDIRNNCISCTLLSVTEHEKSVNMIIRFYVYFMHATYKENILIYIYIYKQSMGQSQVSRFSSKISYILFLRRAKLLQVWNDMG